MARERPDVIARALDGDEGAWRAIVDAVGPSVLGYARSRGVRDAEDILSETLLGLTKAIRRFEGDEAGLRALAMKIARDRIADRYRRAARQNESPVDEVPERAGGSDAAGPALGDAVLIQVLGLLPEAQREAVYLRIVCDLSSEEVGRIIGKRPGAVRVMVHRALQKMRAALDQGAVTI